MDWTIDPHQGVGPLRFGMSPAEVAKADPAIGAPHDSHQGFGGSLREFRGIDLPALSYRENGLREIDCDFRVPGVRFEAMDVFAVEPEIVIRRLFARNGGALYSSGDLLFLALGINTGGFYDPQTRRFTRLGAAGIYPSLTAFAPGTFDDLLAEFEPIELP